MRSLAKKLFLGKQLMNERIESWFPTSIYVADEVLPPDQLQLLEDEIKQVFSQVGAFRNGINNIDSSHKTNKMLHNNPVFKPLVDQIYSHAKNYLEAYGMSDELIQNVNIDVMWANISYEGDYIFPHVHGNSLVSGVFYIRRAGDCNISFFKSLDKYSVMTDVCETRNRFNADSCEYECLPGRLMLFTGDTLHGTARQPAGEKIVISFNIK
jgi:uncharacterized protein (TIGR02466 family)